MLNSQQVNCTPKQMPQPLSNKNISQLFVRLGSNYGHLWTSAWKTAEMIDAARKEWALELGRYDLGTIGMALRKCKATYLDHAPTLPQFSALCKSCKPSTAAHSEYKCLEHQVTDPDKAKENLKNLREAIAGTRVLIDEDIMQGGS